jgi:hypothetical protein
LFDVALWGKFAERFGSIKIATHPCQRSLLRPGRCLRLCHRRSFRGFINTGEHLTGRHMVADVEEKRDQFAAHRWADINLQLRTERGRSPQAHEWRAPTRQETCEPLFSEETAASGQLLPAKRLPAWQQQ